MGQSSALAVRHLGVLSLKILTADLFERRVLRHYANSSGKRSYGGTDIAIFFTFLTQNIKLNNNE